MPMITMKGPSNNYNYGRYQILFLMLGLFTCITSFTLVMAVDRSKFRTCSQTSFCRRHRQGRSKAIYKYNLDPTSIQFHPLVKGGDEHQQQQPPQEEEDAVNKEDSTNPGYMSKIKQMLTRQTLQNENESIGDPYVKGPKPFFTAKLVNSAPITSTGSQNERLNIGVHLHEDGVARIRITEEYDEELDEASSSRPPFTKARWTSDALVLNFKEMEYANNIQTIDDSTQQGEKLIQQLTSTVQMENDEKDNFVIFRYGTASSYDTQGGECTGSSVFMIRFQPFTMHLWRNKDCEVDEEGDIVNETQFGQPIISVNTDSLLHFEIRRLKEGENPRQEEDKVESTPQGETHAETTDDEDRHGGKEIVGYWEDGLAIYADGTREEKTEKDSIVQEQRRVLTDETDNGEFHFDTDGMWEEKFGDHLDTKPFGPMSIGADITFPTSKHLFGLPEHASSTQLKGTTGGDTYYKEPYRLYNLDVFEYEVDETMALYGEVPLIVSQNKDSGTAGVFWFNPTETFVDVETPTGFGGTKTHWISESGILDLFLLPGPNPRSLYQQYATLTGRMPLPPMWTLGYHQCRWNYRDETDVYQVHGKFEELDYPYDVLWLDIEHTNDKRYFTWAKHLFPNPVPMQEKLSSQGRRMVTIVDPHIKRDNNYYIHKTASSKGLYIKDKDGKKDYDGWCWPGSSSYLDFTNESVRNWWAEQFGYDKYIGSTPSLFTWNDMNEPSVFNGPEVSMQKDLRNLGGIEHREWHNLYGMLFQRSTAEGLTLRNADENVRPFVLSRSFFAGSQRYGSIWTGDNESTWPHLKIASPMLLSLNIAALSFVGADVGGFFGNPDAELMTRWMQAGAYQPFFRGHAHHDAKRREPWMFGDEWMHKMRHAAMARYALLPYWYTVFKEAGDTGMPVMRTMWMEFPELEQLYGVDDQYLIGSDILVKPITDAGATQTTVQFPTKYTWYDVDTMAKVPLAASSETKNDAVETITVESDIDKIPVYQRGGSIIARKLRLRRSSEMMKKDPYTLYIALDNEGTSASGRLYMDDEISFDNERKGHFCEANLSINMNKSSIENNVITGNKDWVIEELSKSHVVERIIIMGLDSSPKAMLLTSGSGEELTFQYDEKSNVLVLKKPNVSAAENWEISITK